MEEETTQLSDSLINKVQRKILFTHQRLARKEEASIVGAG